MEERPKPGIYSRAQRIFAVLFIIFAVALTVSAYMVRRNGLEILRPPTPTFTPGTPPVITPGTTPSPVPQETPGAFPGDIFSMSGWAVATLTSCIGSLVTLAGFVSTTLISWRKENREDRSASQQEQQRQMEMEKLRLELNKLKEQYDKDQDQDDEEKP